MPETNSAKGKCPHWFRRWWNQHIQHRSFRAGDGVTRGGKKVCDRCMGWPMILAAKQTAWAYCPGCRLDLCSSKGTTHTDTDLVRFTCGNCGAQSAWDFDAPVPLLMSGRANVV